MIEEELKSKADYWVNMPRNPEEQQQYYQEEILPLLIDYFVQKQRVKLKKQYEAMIMSIGDSYVPLVLLIKTFEPSKVCFISTDRTRKYIDLITRFTGLSSS